MKRNVTRHAVEQPLDQSYRIIPLTRGYNATVDAEDFERVNQWNWQAIPSKKTSNVYAARTETLQDSSRVLVLMHRFILKCVEDVDHRDGNTLNNRRYNLRPCNDTQNAGNQKKSKNNKSGYKGVSWHKPSGKWIVHIYFMNKQIHLGLFTSAIEAAKSYDRKAIELFGEFARLNFSRDSYQ